jgi:hypothetical protein
MAAMMTPFGHARVDAFVDSMPRMLHGGRLDRIGRAISDPGHQCLICAIVGVLRAVEGVAR